MQKKRDDYDDGDVDVTLTLLQKGEKLFIDEMKWIEPEFAVE